MNEQPNIDAQAQSLPPLVCSRQQVLNALATLRSDQQQQQAIREVFVLLDHRLCADESTLEILEEVLKECSAYDFVITSMGNRRGFSFPVEKIASLLNATAPNKLMSFEIQEVNLLGEMTPLVDALERQTQLEEFSRSYSCSSAGESDPVALAGAVSRLQCLRSVQYEFPRNSALDHDTALQMVTPLLRMNALEELELEYLPAEILGDFFTALNDSTCRVKTLKLNVFRPGSLISSQTILNQVASMLEQNSCLEELHTGIDKKISIANLGVALQRNTSLRVLDLWFMGVCKKNDVDVFLDLLENYNTTLQVMEGFLFHLPKTDKETNQKIDKIHFLLELNRNHQRNRLLGATLQHHADAEDPTNDDWVDVILSSKNNVSVLFYYLSINPSLMLAKY
jgi:hypothetical protein